MKKTKGPTLLKLLYYVLQRKFSKDTMVVTPRKDKLRQDSEAGKSREMPPQKKRSNLDERCK